MKKISRGEFVKMGALGLAASVVPINIWPANENKNYVKNDIDDKDFFDRLLKANDIASERLLGLNGNNQQGRSFGRPSAGFSILVASYCQPNSKYYRSRIALNKLNEMISDLLESLNPEGTIISGGNIDSPPDTAFLLDHLCFAAKIINQQDFMELKELKEKLSKFLLYVGEALIIGGLHTPNHRWEVASALTSLYSIFNNDRYLKRAEEWLAEGIDINQDGSYGERSMGYAGVVNRSLLNMGRVLNRPSFFEIVSKNLEATYYYMETNGDLVTLASRRQDQYSVNSITGYYLFYRYLAIHDNNEFFAAIAREIETFNGFENNILSRSLIFVMEDPLLGKKLPESKKLPTDYSKLFALSSLARIRRENITASIFGGNDKPIIIASGRSCIPTYFTFRKGSAILEYARMSSSFFSMGYFRSDGIIKEGNKYILHETKEAYYYHPMPENKRNANGDYLLSPSIDGRFWSKMDFENRPKTTLTLDTNVILEEENGVIKIDFEVNGPKKVPVTLEFCFRTGGKLEGVTSTDSQDDYMLKDGYARYLFGNDLIEIGPGKVEHNNIQRLDGEMYSTHFGTIKGKGMHVYLTGHVPFKHSIIIK
jgi:hypothetical protein